MKMTMKKILLSILLAIVATGADAQFKGSVDIKPIQNAKPREISFNFAAVCRQLGVDRQEFATLLQREWYRQDSQFKLYLLTDAGSGYNDVSTMLTADGRRAEWDDRMWQCEVYSDNVGMNRLYFNVSLCLSERGDRPFAKVGDVCHAVYALEYQEKIATFDITLNVTEKDGPLIPLNSLEKVGEELLTGTCDYQDGLTLQIDLDKVAALFGGDVEGPNLQFYVMEDAERELITGCGIGGSATLNIDGTVNRDENPSEWIAMGYAFGNGSLSMGYGTSADFKQADAFPGGQKTSGSVFLVADGKYYELKLDIQFGEKEDDDSTLMGYRPIIEEGKTWLLGLFDSDKALSDHKPDLLYCHYLQGDTLIGGILCKRWMQAEIADDSQRVEYAGAAYEKNGRVYLALPGTTVFLLLYDFTSPMGQSGEVFDYSEQQMTPYAMGSIVFQSDECHKGFAREVSLGNDEPYTKWMYGVGYMGLYSGTTYEGDGIWQLISCAVGDEVLYYDATLMDWDKSAEAKKKKLDFTHVIKAQPRAPRRRAASADQDGLSGEYSDAEVFVWLNNLEGNYTATLTDASGQVVYQKTMLTDNVLALNTALTAYGPGSYVLTLENDDEAFTATLNIEPNGIRPTPSPSLGRGAIYDLQGRKLMKAPEKGMYIQDGKKKMMVK